MGVELVVEHYFVSILATNCTTFSEMKPTILLFCCCIALALAREKQTSLEDIERDNIARPIAKEVVNIPTGKPPGSPTSYGFLPVKTAQDYARTEPKQQYIQPQAYQQQYYQQPQYYYQQPYQQYENVQYIADNAIPQQQYYAAQTQQPQYVYLQQYTAPSTAVQTVVDPKGGLQYFMYVPSTYFEKNQEEAVPQQQQQQVGIVYANDYSSSTEEQQPEVPPPQRKEPKSLLDSYVPSILQIQYYKQQQASNSIQQSLKEISSASQIKRPLAPSASNLNYNYIPSH